MENEQSPEEQYANWKAPENSVDDEVALQKKIAVRLNQSFASRLCEYITGMTPEDPRMIERLKADQEIIRAKYSLPKWDMPPYETERYLMQIAKNVEAKIKSKSECGKFFEENPLAGAVHFGEGSIGIDINRADRKEYLKSLNTLEHELIHSLQDKYAHSMPIELMEYEAYVAGANIDYLKKDPEAINDVLFNFFIGVSVNTHYRLESKKRGEEVKPAWDNPEFFLKKDGIDTNEVKAQTEHDQ